MCKLRSPLGSWQQHQNRSVGILKNHPKFAIDKSMQYDLLVTVAPDGYLKRVK